MGMAFALGFALFSRTSQSVTADKVADLRNMFQDAYTGWLSALGLGCVKTRRRATTIEQTFVQNDVRCAKIR